MIDNSLKVCTEEARQFFALAKQCEETLDGLVIYTYAFSVNITFACELFMKAILIYEETTENIKTHKMKELFKLISAEAQEVIKNKFPGDLDKLLDEIDDSFVKWRYAFENRVSIDVTNTMNFAKVLNEYLAETGN